MDANQKIDITGGPNVRQITVSDKSRTLIDNPYLKRNRREEIRAEILEGKINDVVQIPKRQAAIKIDAVKTADRKIRVAGYCRVSTGNELQETSIDAQRKHYESYIRSNPDWEFAGIYWEVEVSGTKKDNRPELNRLIDDCRSGRVDLILTKSISRFSRNTTDCLEMVRTLTGFGVKILFEKENIHTGTMESELLLTLFSSFAEEESKSISANVTWSVRNRFEKGTYKFSKAPYGYRLVDGSLEVDLDKALIVKEIFGETLSGKGAFFIAEELNARNISTGTKKLDGSPGKWTASMILAMLKNVVYIGDILHQKTFSENFRCKINYGERQMYYNEGHHEAIIDPETFRKANSEVRRRDREQGNRISLNRHLRKDPRHRSYIFSGKLKCECCGANMKRVTQKVSSGKRYHWVCSDHLKDPAKCAMKRQNETDIKNAFLTMLNKMKYAGNEILDIYVSGITQEENEQNAAKIKKLDQEIKRILDEKNRLTLLISKGCGEPVSYRMQIIKLQARENSIRYEIRQCQEKSGILCSVSELRESIAEWKRDGDPDSIFSKIVKEAEVMTGEHVIFQLKCGLRLTESLKK